MIYFQRRLLLALCCSPFVALASSDAVFGVPKTSNVPEWLSIHKDKDKMSKYMELARQRHAKSIQDARDNYFHGGPVAGGGESPIGSVIMDEYEIQAAGSIPDFVDELERRVFVTSKSTPLFTKEECRDMISKAEEHFKGEEWTTLPSGQFDVAGFWIKSIPACHEWFNKMVQERLFPLLVKNFPDFAPNMEDLVVDNAYLFKYTPETGRRTDVHTDSGCLSFTIALNDRDEYEGGGTWFEGLQGDGDVLEMSVGQCTVRPGGVRHCGHAVTQGTRYIIGGFCMNNKKIEYARMLMGLGSEEAQKQNYALAQEALETAIVLSPNFYGPYSHLADVYEKQGNVAKAQQVLEHCFHNVNPQCGEIAYSLGTLYFDKGEWDKTIKCMNACLEADETDVDAMDVMAQACAGKGDKKGEEAWYQRIIATPGASKKVASKAFCNLGVMYEGTDQEIEYYEKSLQLIPDNFPPCYSLACAYASKKDYDPAIVMFRRAIEISTDKSEDQSQALQNLYRVIMMKLQSENPNGPQSRDDMMKKFMEMMGQENYEKLAAMRPQQ